MIETHLDLDYIRGEVEALSRMAYTHGRLERSECTWLFGAITDLVHEVERLTKERDE